MILTVNTNITSSYTHHQLENNTTNLDTSLQHLSTEQHINNTKDDAANMQISNHLNSQTQKLNITMHNTNDDISLLQIAKGTLQNMTNTLQRIRTLNLQTSIVTGKQQNLHLKHDHHYHLPTLPYNLNPKINQFKLLNKTN